MKRLTYKHDEKWCISGLNGKLVSDKMANYWGKAIDRLAEYEDTDLSPTDISFLRNYLPNANFLLAKAQGRLIILNDPQTNADRIRAMSDEELAKDRVKYKISNGYDVWTGDFDNVAGNYKEAIQKELDWLRQPAEEVHDERKA